MTDNRIRVVVENGGPMENYILRRPFRDDSRSGRDATILAFDYLKIWRITKKAYAQFFGTLAILMVASLIWYDDPWQETRWAFWAGFTGVWALVKFVYWYRREFK